MYLDRRKDDLSSRMTGRASERQRERGEKEKPNRRRTKRRKLTVAVLSVLEGGGAEGDSALIVAAWPVEQEEEATRIG